MEIGLGQITLFVLHGFFLTSLRDLALGFAAYLSEEGGNWPEPVLLCRGFEQPLFAFLSFPSERGVDYRTNQDEIAHTDTLACRWVTSAHRRDPPVGRCYRGSHAGLTRRRWIPGFGRVGGRVGPPGKS